MSDLDVSVHYVLARARVDAQRFIDEAWAELDGHARHVCSLVAPHTVPSPRTVAALIGAELQRIAAVAPPASRAGERIAAARPFIDAVLAGTAPPPVSLVDLLFTLDRMIAGLAARVPTLATIRTAVAAA